MPTGERFIKRAPNPLEKIQRNSSPSINCVMVYGRLRRLHVYRAEPRIPFTIRVKESVSGESQTRWFREHNIQHRMLGTLVDLELR